MNVIAISLEFYHVVVVANIDKKKVKNVVRKTFFESKKISLPKDEIIRKQFEENVIEL